MNFYLSALDDRLRQEGDGPRALDYVTTVAGFLTISFVGVPILSIVGAAVTQVRFDDGRVVVGGRVLGDGDLDWWRDRVGWASQHPVLVPGTVADNVALGRPGAGPAAIREAASHPLHQRNDMLWLRGIKAFMDGGMLTGSATRDALAGLLRGRRAGRRSARRDAAIHAILRMAERVTRGGG